MSSTDRFRQYDKLVGINYSQRTSRDNNFKHDIQSNGTFSKSNTQNFKSANDMLRAVDRVQYDVKDTRTNWTIKGRATDYEVFSGKNIGFDKTSPRFNYNQVFYG